MDHSTRRAFAQAAFIPAASAFGSQANSAVSVGLIGSGNRGPFVAGLLAEHTPARVTAVCDVIEDRVAAASKKFGNARQYLDLNELLRSNVDAVIIATPVYLHAEHFEASVKAGKHIYIEKPASVDVEGCRRIMRAADSADRKLNITFGFQRRYAEVYRKAYKVVESGAIGKIHLAAARFIKSEGVARRERQVPSPANDAEKNLRWLDFRNLSGDLIVENNVHLIDVLNWFIGARPERAIGSGGSRLPKAGDLRDHNFVAFTYPDGTQAQLSGTSLAPPGYRDVVEQFFGPKGMIETSENHWRHYRSRGDETFEKTPRNLTIDAVTEFVSRIAQGRPENTAIRGAESTLTAILGRMAMDARREVTWDEMMKSP
ncbi:MAG: Gfo/Idh/MocA family protein [Bryobacteraceae bacterium]